MEKVIGIGKWLAENWVMMLGVLSGFIFFVAEPLTRLSKTKKDDGFVKRVGGLIDRAYTVARFPNRVKEAKDKMAEDQKKKMAEEKKSDRQ